MLQIIFIINIRWDLMLTEAARLDQGLGDLTTLVALLPAQAEELSKWIVEQDSVLCSREICALEIKTFKTQVKTEDVSLILRLVMHSAQLNAIVKYLMCEYLMF